MEFGGYKGTGPRVRVRRRAELGRRLTRRLSLVAKMPAAILSKANPPEPRPVEITAIAPDKTQLTVSKLPFILSHFSLSLSTFFTAKSFSKYRNYEFRTRFPIDFLDRLLFLFASHTPRSYIPVLYILWESWRMLDRLGYVSTCR